MPILNSKKREIDIKIVYYGPALCGKTTNLQTIFKKLAPHQRGEMVSLATKDDRTLFFDFLPIELGNVKGYKTCVYRSRTGLLWFNTKGCIN